MSWGISARGLFQLDTANAVNRIAIARKRGLNSEFTTAIEHEISDLVQHALTGTLDFETLEGVVRKTPLRIGAEVLESMINAANDDVSPSITHPDDDTVLTYAGKRAKTFVTVLGDITLTRAYYTDGTGRGYFPQDRTLGFDTDCLSGGVKRMIGHICGKLQRSPTVPEIFDNKQKPPELSPLQNAWFMYIQRHR